LARWTVRPGGQHDCGSLPHTPAGDPFLPLSLHAALRGAADATSVGNPAPPCLVAATAAVGQGRFVVPPGPLGYGKSYKPHARRSLTMSRAIPPFRADHVGSLLA